MLFLAFIALLLHPLLYFDGIRFYMDCPSYFFLHIFAYTIFGNLIWNVLKHKAWWISALAIVAGVNIVLLIYIYFFVKSWDVRDALTVLLFLFDFGFAAVFLLSLSGYSAINNNNQVKSRGDSLFMNRGGGDFDMVNGDGLTTTCQTPRLIHEILAVGNRLALNRQPK
jgi:phosphoglycerol transferase MdoB-like AlkP superfamily enzyme